MNNRYNIWKGNAPPEVRQKEKGKSKKCSILRMDGTLNFELSPLNLSERAKRLLKLRDGPPGRLPVSGVPVTLYSSGNKEFLLELHPDYGGTCRRKRLCKG